MSKKMKPENKKYEGDILSSYESGEWKSVANLDDETARYASSAAATLTKDKRINIRLCARDEKQSDKCRMCQEEESRQYWCEQCNQAVADKRCPLCGLKARRMKSQQ